MFIITFVHFKLELWIFFLLLKGTNGFVPVHMRDIGFPGVGFNVSLWRISKWHEIVLVN